MKAIVYRTYGPPDVLKLEEVAKPIPKDDELLVKVQAASVNSWDWDLMRGKPLIYRLMFGLLKPRRKIIGSDIAGRVEAIGKNVKQFQPGDEVFGDISGNGFGAFAEYVCARENIFARKPAGMTFEQAAATPQAAVLALQGLRNNGKIRKGQKVLINGAGGGVGTFALQIAKYMGAEVTCVDCGEKLDMLLSMGADDVIDYRQNDFSKNGEHYDLILDVVVHNSIFDYKRALSRGGIFVPVGGSVTSLLQALLLWPWISMFGTKKMSLLAYKPNKEDLNFMKGLFEIGKVVPVIDKCYSLSEVGEALRYFGEGKFKGKIVITM